jgi:hypothetical protein
MVSVDTTVESATLLSRITKVVHLPGLPVWGEFFYTRRTYSPFEPTSLHGPSVRALLSGSSIFEYRPQVWKHSESVDQGFSHRIYQEYPTNMLKSPYRIYLTAVRMKRIKMDNPNDSIEKTKHDGATFIEPFDVFICSSLLLVEARKGVDTTTLPKKYAKA